ncbi:MAG TPA: hypothetical protein VF595_17235 [Tepidisphaeraceae bacterium]|jgi:hypothetical protein
MEAVNDWVDFVPERSQLARVSHGKVADAPSPWVAVAAVAAALGLSLSLALPPATKVRHGTVTKQVETPAEIVTSER